MFYTIYDEALSLKTDIIGYMVENDIVDEFTTIYDIYQRSGQDKFLEMYPETLWMLFVDFEGAMCEMENLLAEMQTDFRNLLSED